MKHNDGTVRVADTFAPRSAPPREGAGEPGVDQGADPVRGGPVRQLANIRARVYEPNDVTSDGPTLIERRPVSFFGTGINPVDSSFVVFRIEPTDTLATLRTKLGQLVKDEGARFGYEVNVMVLPGIDRVAL